MTASPAEYANLADPPRGAVGQYTLVAKLGQGGMAEVFLAVARGPVSDFHKLVVLKRLRATLQSDTDFVKMFVREAKIAARLNHPSVVHTYSVDLEDGLPVIVMEYLDGVSLSALMKRLIERPFAERLPLLGAVATALSGLHYVHELRDYDGSPMGLVHRDIKPANLFVTFDGQVKVVDFGIAKATAPGQDATQSAAFKGTVRYMAPEAVVAGSVVDARADLFSAGVMIWEAASATRLWDGLEQLQVIRRLMDNDVPSLDSLAADVPPELTALCAKALQLKPEERHVSAAALRNELLSFLRAQGIQDVEEELRGVMDVEFGHRRKRRSDAIAARLEEAMRAPTPLDAEDVDLDDVPTLTPADATSSAGHLAPPPRARPARHTWIGIGAVGAASVAGVALWLGGSTGADVTPTQSAPEGTHELERTEAPLAEPPRPAAAVAPRPDATPPSDAAAVPRPPPESSAKLEAEAPEDLEPLAAPPTRSAKPRPRRRRVAKAADERAPAEPTSSPKTKESQPLEPGQLPTKHDDKAKPTLQLDKDSPWGGGG